MQSKMTVGMFALAGLLGACTPSPQKVCEHAASLEGTAHPDRPAEARTAAQNACVAMLTSIQSAHAAEYKTAATCVMSATAEPAMMACMMPLASYMMH